MKAEHYERLYTCHSFSPDCSMCVCECYPKPDYEECCECGEYIISDEEKVYRSVDGNKYCSECFPLYLSDWTVDWSILNNIQHRGRLISGRRKSTSKRGGGS